MSKNTEVTDEIISMIYKFSEATGGATKEIITSYSQWHFYNALGWLIFGVLSFIVFTILSFKKYDGPYQGMETVCIGFAIISCFFVFGNMADIFAPESTAIKELIKQIKK